MQWVRHSKEDYIPSTESHHLVVSPLSSGKGDFSINPILVFLPLFPFYCQWLKILSLFIFVYPLHPHLSVQLSSCNSPHNPFPCPFTSPFVSSLGFLEASSLLVSLVYDYGSFPYLLSLFFWSGVTFPFAALDKITIVAFFLFHYSSVSQ